METQTIDNTNKLSAIELALAAAKARKAAKEQSGSSTDTNPEDRATIKAQIEADRAARKARREAAENTSSTTREEKAAAKAAKKAAKAAEAANGRPTHMKKVERAKSKLAPMCTAAADLLTTAKRDLAPIQLEVLAQHLIVAAREQRTLGAHNASILPVGTSVQITAGDPRFIGARGTVVKSHKLRLLVAVEGLSKPIYIYAGEALPV